MKRIAPKPVPTHKRDHWAELTDAIIDLAAQVSTQTQAIDRLNDLIAWGIQNGKFTEAKDEQEASRQI